MRAAARSILKDTEQEKKVGQHVVVFVAALVAVVVLKGGFVGSLTQQHFPGPVNRNFRISFTSKKFYLVLNEIAYNDDIIFGSLRWLFFFATQCIANIFCPL